ncbi:MAG: glutamate--tRNA ligase [Bacteroidetes bacterium]|nr:glutamate--tRNA ligase [Bacteroidota bacterium]
MNKIRVRFAPSPTGPQHIGGIRTALYNYLFAKKNRGDFILRIEDTDQKRFVEGSQKYLLKAFEWLNIKPDEGINIGGKYGPYKQSERKDIYKKYIDILLKKDLAYYAFDTPQELDEMRKRLQEAKVAAPQYNAVSRMTMKNSLTLPKDEVEQKLNSGEKYVIRIKVPQKQSIKFKDEIRGWINIKTDVLDDKVLMKSDGMPTYHFANVVDDHLMKITHVIRGEEWLPSTPIHILLYKYFEWEEPVFAHLPLILKPDGVGKLSKRAADQAGFPVFPLNWIDPETKEKSEGFKESGYLPEAIINFLAMLGWSPGDNRELFTIDQLIKEFSLERINKAGVKFDIKKVNWFNQEYLKRKEPIIFVNYLKTKIPTAKEKYSDKLLEEICDLLKDRLIFLKDLISETKFFFKKPISYDKKLIKKLLNEDSIPTLMKIADAFDSLTFFEAPYIKEAFLKIIEDKELKLGKILPVLRLAITGLGSGPDLSKVIYILGKKESLERLDKFLDSYK